MHLRNWRLQVNDLRILIKCKADVTEIEFNDQVVFDGYIEDPESVSRVLEALGYEVETAIDVTDTDDENDEGLEN